MRGGLKMGSGWVNGWTQGDGHSQEWMEETRHVYLLSFTFIAYALSMIHYKNEFLKYSK